MKQNTSYWATVAQIMPVIMLALIVEARVTLRQLTRKQAYPHNVGVRVTYAVVFLVNCLALTVGFSVALRGARGSSTPYPLNAIAETALVVGISTAFMTPAINIITALLGDKLVELHRRMPYSRAARARRLKDRRRKVLDEIARDFRSFRLQSRIDIADMYIRAYSSFRETNRTRRDVLDFEELITIVDKSAKSMSERLTDLEGRIAVAIADLETNQALLSSLERDGLRSILKSNAGV